LDLDCQPPKLLTPVLGRCPNTYSNSLQLRCSWFFTKAYNNNMQPNCSLLWLPLQVLKTSCAAATTTTTTAHQLSYSNRAGSFACWFAGGTEP